ncbi:hypothetical protein P3W85_14500 [Cupriavidus basilensis]|uniref:Uncharacterized protein n=1 Tax=Cupriavidus basilensis TaxID=68895 RepID=A0ABT6ANF6_9BURK|nr:hypothetical protein [Cupriavidus basilensis]MDF3834157.1 hypothetical protein [Cupriavidus basilensis]
MHLRRRFDSSPSYRVNVKIFPMSRLPLPSRSTAGAHVHGHVNRERDLGRLARLAGCGLNGAGGLAWPSMLPAAQTSIGDRPKASSNGLIVLMEPPWRLLKRLAGAALLRGSGKQWLHA